MKLGVESPDVLVDVTRLPHDAIEELDGGGLRIGAAVRNTDLAASLLVRERYPVLAQAVLAGASGQLRNMATVGGNLLQRTRCAYFQDVTKPCNKREPGSGCPARAGHHRNHAILGHSEACVATHPSDMAVALAALGASVHVEGRDGPRAIPMPGLHRLPGDEPQRDTELAPGRADHRRRAAAAGDRPRAPPTARCASGRRSRSPSSPSPPRSTSRDGVVEDVPDRARRRRARSVAGARAEEALRGRPATEEAFGEAADAELAARRPAAGQRVQGPARPQRVIVRTLRS